MMLHEYPAEIAEEQWKSVPKPGQVIWVRDEEHIVLRVSICNNSKVELKTYPKGDIKYYEDPTDVNSLEYSEFSEKFFQTEREEFLEKGSLTHD